ncbi:MAG: DUF460 domain-containing protein, partial [Pyrobaculum sp.]
EILTNYGSKYKLLHLSELVECKGGESVGIICKNIDTVQEAVARGTMGVPLKQVAKLQLGEFFVIDFDAVRELTEEIKRHMDSQKDLDLKKIVQQYRRMLGGV